MSILLFSLLVVLPLLAVTYGNRLCWGWRPFMGADAEVDLLIEQWENGPGFDDYFTFARNPDAIDRDLRRLGAAAVPELNEILRHSPSSRKRQIAAQALGLIGPEAKAGVPALIGALKDSDDLGLVQAAAAKSLGVMRNPESLRLLVETINHPIDRVRAAATTAVSAFEEKDYVPLVVELLENQKLGDNARDRAVFLLSETADVLRTRNLLEKIQATDTSPEVRVEAAKSLTTLRPKT